MPMIPSHSFAALLTQVEALCREAGAMALSQFRLGQQTTAKVWSKAGGSPVTEADVTVDTFLKIRLSELMPDAAWLSEETADDHVRLGARHVWVVDPIDGTRAFMAGLPDWAVCVALLENDRPVLGVVHAPAHGATYVALEGSGAARNGVALAVSLDGRLEEARIAGPRPMQDALERLQPFTLAAKIPSLALRLAYIADGQIEAGLVSPDSRDWDLAAADLILSEAGGLLTGTDGNRLVFNRPDPVHGVLVASTAMRHPPLLSLMQRLREMQGSRA
ncbi:MAG: 3'(2'),5'-bisphosphate nucleotidase CysQ [Bosea sp. (in: a-proteobacteria)]